jgi:hypothetical protein
MGVVVSLVEKAQEQFDEDEALKMQDKMAKGSFTFDDFLKQMGAMKKMGGMKDIMKLVPGLGSQMAGMDVDEGEIKRIEAIVQSMTKQERRDPDVIDASRRRRIARGSGTAPTDVSGSSGPPRFLLQPCHPWALLTLLALVCLSDMYRSDLGMPMQDFMQALERWAQSITDFLNTYVVEIGPSFGGENVPIMVLALLGTGVYLTLRLGFIQLRHLGHGFAVTTGKYDDPEEPGDVSHFQALTTALSATVGIGNIAGVALAIHLGGPGALFWMWVTALPSPLGGTTTPRNLATYPTFRPLPRPFRQRWVSGTSPG